MEGFTVAELMQVDKCNVYLHFRERIIKITELQTQNFED
jgi:hypothetical protein